jgi:hypothetical protein
MRVTDWISLLVVFTKNEQKLVIRFLQRPTCVCTLYTVTPITNRLKFPDSATSVIEEKRRQTATGYVWVHLEGTVPLKQTSPMPRA